METVRPPDLGSLYPATAAFQQEDVPQLQARLARAEAEIARLRRELEYRQVGKWVSIAGRYLWKKVNRIK